jgi:hypothetical protein
MRKSLLKQITWEEVKEISDMIDSVIVPFDDDEKTEDEVFYTEVLRHLRNENDVPPPIEERYPGVLACAERVCGNKLTDSRERENILIRSFAAYKLHEEGYSYSEIGKMMKRDHSTITNLVHRVRDMLSLPNAYKWEVQQYKRFEELL